MREMARGRRLREEGERERRGGQWAYGMVWYGMVWYGMMDFEIFQNRPICWRKSVKQ